MRATRRPIIAGPDIVVTARGRAGITRPRITRQGTPAVDEEAVGHAGMAGVPAALDGARPAGTPRRITRAFTILENHGT